MKSTGFPQVAALLAALALALPACLDETEGETAPDETGTSAAALDEAAGPERGKDARRGRDGMRRGMKHMKQRFEEADQNSDGSVTKAELEAALSARFAAADSNGDGALAADELEAMKAQHQAKRFGQIDADGNGVVSREEAPGRLGTHFDRLDTDGDGSLSQAELSAMRDRGKRGGKRGPGKRGPGKMDADGDGQVTAEEFISGGARWFARADANGDDTVTLAEFESGHKAMRGKRGGHGMKGKKGKRGRMWKHLQEADADGDGQITKAELAAHRTARFDEADANRDGVLVDEELAALHQHKAKARGRKGPGKMGRMGNRLDADGDGQVSRDEFLSKTDRMFEKLDANSDEILSKDELEARARHSKRGGGRSRK